MAKAYVPADEPERLRALEECCIFDTAPEKIFDDLTRLAAKLCGAPIALVSLIDSERQWFKSVVGLRIQETHRDIAFCSHAIVGSGPLVISDATLDPRTSDNPLVARSPRIRFYAGIPLRTSDGHALGTLCVIDTVPRELTGEQLADLKTLAAHVFALLELRRTNRKLVEEKETLVAVRNRLDQIAAQVPGVVYQYLLRPDGTSCFPYASNGIREIYRVAPEDVRTDASDVFKIIHPEDYEGIAASIQESARTLRPWCHEYWVRFPDGEIRWLCGNAKPSRQLDDSILWHGFTTDITKQRNERDEAKRLRSQLQGIVDASTQVAIISSDLRGTISVFNTGAEKMLGYTAKELIGIETPKIFHIESEVRARGEQRLKGTMSVVQANSALESARRLEESASNDDLVSAAAQLETLQREIEPLQPLLSDLVVSE